MWCPEDNCGRLWWRYPNEGDRVEHHGKDSKVKKDLREPNFYAGTCDWTNRVSTKSALSTVGGIVAPSMFRHCFGHVVRYVFMEFIVLIDMCRNTV